MGIKKTLITCWFCGLAGSVGGQGLLVTSPQLRKFEVRAGAALPLFYFGNAYESIGYTMGWGHAGNGILAGGKFLIPWQRHNIPAQNIRGLYLTFSADAMFNPLNMDYVVTHLPHKEREGISEMSPSRFAYLNFPLTAGLNGEVSLNTNIAIYGEFGIGANISKITNASLKYSFAENNSKGVPSSWEYASIVRHHTAFDFAYTLEGGIIINDLVTVGIKYLALGSRKHKYTLSITETERAADGEVRDDTQTGRFDKPLSITALSVFVGVKIYYRDCYPCLPK